MSRSALRLTAFVVALVLAGILGGTVRARGAPAAWPTPIALGKEAMYAEFNEGDLRTADNLSGRRGRRSLRCTWPGR
jgi:hypothetical protein